MAAIALLDLASSDFSAIFQVTNADHFGISKAYADNKRRRLGLPARKPRKGAGGFGGFGGITLQEWREQELGRLMAAAA